jgi:hypothetical protein
MKYFLIFLLSFAFINPVLAANVVKGTVPKLLPLQPAPAGISPAYNKNIQYQDPNYVPSVGDSNASQGSRENQPPGQSSASGQASLDAVLQSASPYRYVWVLAALLAAAVLSFLFYKRNRTK